VRPAAGLFRSRAPRSEGKYSVERDGTPKPDHTYWKGFKARTATGLVLEHLKPEQEAPAPAPSA